jgi:23S rRNA pseudouridine1911/1915/1917 synthase
MITILYEDNHCLVIDKPAGLLSQGDATGQTSLVELAAADLKERYNKPGNVFVGLVHRLDRPVSGVVLLAKTSKAAARLAEQFRAGLVEKTYLAVVAGRVTQPEGVWHDFLVKDSKHNTVAPCDETTAGSRKASLRFRLIEQGPDRTTLEVQPLTGRSHQIRVQLATRGWPIVGDRKYGDQTPLKALDGGFRIALHAIGLRFKHPTRAESIEVHAQVPADWPSR